MVTTQPKWQYNLIIKDVRIEPNESRIYYKLYYAKDDTEKFWDVPNNSTFAPPDWFGDGVACKVWTEDISKTRVIDYDWIYVEQVPTKVTTDLARRVKGKQITNQLNKVDNELTILRNLFEGF
jgi:hypothetical protein